MKKFLILIISSFLIITSSGCFKKDTFENITIYTTNYSTEYITNYLYGEHSTIYSIYPNGTNISKYSLTKKQIKDYSKGNMYVFNGLNSKEQEYLIQMVDHNKNLKMIDTTESMEITNGEEELWLDPSNFLMTALNIKENLLEYVTNHYLIEEINTNYDELKIKISNIDAKLKLMSESSDKKTIIVDTNTLKFLDKYGFNIISLEEDETLTEKTITNAENSIKDGAIKYIYTFDKENLNETVKKIVENTIVNV